MEIEYKINFVVDGEPFDTSMIEELYGWYKSKGKDREKAIRNLVEKVQKAHPRCNVLVLGDFIQTSVYWNIIGYAARTKENPSFTGAQSADRLIPKS
ncbi:MAG TPA: hypothetical protein VK206_05385 [Anaerolineales bacterium]|nr:hypothetical protein [Anaerolineales bacterium]HLO29941.1 hypothetical protein [Anaerolineales bacterium]